MTKRLSWLLVGAGDIACKRVAPALISANASTLAAVCEINPERRRSLMEKLNLDTGYESLEDALADPEIDAVYLATPIRAHVPQAILALQAGKSVLVEKPLGLDTAEIKPLLQIASQSPGLSACSYYRRALRRFAIARQMLENGELGEIVGGNMIYYSNFAPQPGDQKFWRICRAQSGGGPLSDMATHMFDFLIGLVGMPKQVDALCANVLYDWEVEDSAAMILTLPNGAPMTASFGWNAGCWRHEFELVGSKGRLTMAPFDSGDLVFTAGREIKRIPCPEADNVHLPFIQNFVDACLEQGKSPLPLSIAAQTNELLDAVYFSSQNGKVVTLR